MLLPLTRAPTILSGALSVETPDWMGRHEGTWCVSGPRRYGSHVAASPLSRKRRHLEPLVSGIGSSASATEPEEMFGAEVRAECETKDRRRLPFSRQPFTHQKFIDELLAAEECCCLTVRA